MTTADRRRCRGIRTAAPVSRPLLSPSPPASRQLTRSIETLAASAQRVGVGPPQGREWFDLLQRKLLPQLQGPPLADRGHRGRHEYRQVGGLQPPCGRNGQRRHAPGRRHEASRLPRSARLRRSRTAGPALRAFRTACLAIGRRSAGRRAHRSDLLAAGDPGAAAAGAGRCPGRRFRRDRELATGPGDPPDGRRADCASDAAEIQRRGGEAVLPRGSRGRQAHHRDLQLLRFASRSRLLAAVAGPLLRGNGRQSGTGLRRALRSRRGG